MKIGIFAIAAICAATGAWAGGMGETAEEPATFAPVADYDWSGAYVGLGIGIADGSVTWEATGIGSGSKSGFDGTTFSVRAGRDWQRGNLVFGALLEGVSGTVSAVDDVNTVFFCGSAGGCTTEIEDYYSVRARVGRAVGQTLIFGTVGLASAQVTGSTPAFGIHGEDRLNGWAYGLGVEHAVRDNLTVSAEYVLNDLGTLDLPFACGPCHTEVKFGTLQLGANYRW
ncbi:outer membrane protein [Albidovulum sediminicola]|uniref:Outer membrane beta-barrel protein n=1 Tax=Albidovulum sediminicola TaxID=2984331 RepID=A0ABT2Z0R3_9RHOB|nr:outer membrane beta-barrel protein [Defluviimonas sp. WL0075]MCV2864739.1 outer membrane beta-barrel protein [Defluviimonas sp. WL0075]